MAEPARHRPVSRQPLETPDAVQRLMAELANGACTGVRAMHAGLEDRGPWPLLENGMTRLLLEQQGLASLEAREAMTLAVVMRVTATLAPLSTDAPRRERYAQGLEILEQARTSWANLAPPDTIATHVHAAVLWFSAWHLMSAGLTTTDILAVLETPAAPAPIAQERLSEGVQKTAQALLTSANLWAGRVKRGLDAVAAERARTTQERLNRQRAEAERVEDERQRQEQRYAACREDNAGQFRSLDGAALRRSILPTWLMLVGLSWVSLFWGALISIPIGVGFGILASAVAGIFAVPLWGTIWGFIGMGAASASTLRRMGFHEFPKDHALMSTCAQYCRQLDIPPPRLGTMDAFNAFAMGTDRNHATVTVGAPLLKTLTPSEVNAVLAHELGHVATGDMRSMVLMRTFQNATVWFAAFQGFKQAARWIICWAAELAILASSRNREYRADAIGAALAGKEAMIGALRKIDKGPALTSDEKQNARFMFRGKVFSTHPSTADRIKALEEETYLRKLPMKG